MVMRQSGFRSKAKETKENLADQHQESYDRKDERGTSLVGSIFDLNILKELGVEKWIPQVGDHIIDVIPFFAGSQHPDKPEGTIVYHINMTVHQRIGPMNDFFVCQKDTWGRPDPICAYISKNRPEKTEWNKIRGYRRCAYLIWCHDNEEEEAKGVQIWEVAHWFFERNVAMIARKPRSGGAIAFSHQDHGKHVFFTITAGKYTDDSGNTRDSKEYGGFQLVDRDEPKIPNHILDQSFSLDEAIIMHPDEETMIEAFYGSAGEPPAQDDGEESRLKKKTPLERAREQANQDETSTSSASSSESSETETSGPEKEEDSASSSAREKEEPELEPDPEPETQYTCPHADIGGEFGVTLETLDECDECKIWEECGDETDRRRKAKSESGKSKLVRR